jgi:hypothetical protein
MEGRIRSALRDREFEAELARSPLPDRRLISAMQNELKSIRQSAEWGNRAVKGPFGRLRTRLTRNTGKRALIIRLCFLLHNYRTRLVGLNQIRTVFQDPNAHLEEFMPAVDMAFNSTHDSSWTYDAAGVRRTHYGP